MRTPTRFIIIDDDPVNNFLCNMIIKEAAGEIEIKTFEVPEKGFEYIATEYANNKNAAILLLDINMPTCSGWEFLDNFEKLDEKIKNQIKIYMLSSSIDSVDKQRALKNKYVMDYIEKPLSQQTVRWMLENEKKAFKEGSELL